MKNHRNKVISIFCVLLLGLSGAVAFAGSTVTITGTVNEDGQLVDETGQIYVIADDDLGWEVMDSVGEQVEVVGMVEEDESGMKVIVVKAFKLVS
jgi:hypothetical protein